MLTNINIIEMNPSVELQQFCPQASKGQKTSINYKVILVTIYFRKSMVMLLLLQKSMVLQNQVTICFECQNKHHSKKKMVNLFPSGHIYRKHYNNKYYLVICQSLISYKSANILYGHEPYLLSPDIALLTTSLQVSKI